MLIYSSKCFPTPGKGCGAQVAKTQINFYFPLCTKHHTNGPGFPLEFALSGFFSFPLILTGRRALLMDSNMLCSYSGPLNNADRSQIRELGVLNLRAVKNPSYNLSVSPL